GDDYAFAIAVDAAGQAHVTGQTSSFNFAPGAGGKSGGFDSFGAKFDAAGQLLWSTFFGGTLDDAGFGIALDSAGMVYIAGQTASPTLAGGSPIPFGGGNDAFVVKLNPFNRTIGYFTFLGGTLDDIANAIAVDALGNAYVTGASPGGAFPTQGT